jgi:curved DNA-binding protein CbpA
MGMSDSELVRIILWDDLLDEATYYELLGVLDIADDEAIKHAFHEFAIAFHPDQHPQLDAEVSPALRRVFQRGAEAYRVLIDPEKRATYDAGLLRGQLRYSRETLRPASGAHVGARTLVDLCKSPGAKLHAQMADQLLTQGDLVGAKTQLLLAIRIDGDNPELTERLDAIDLALFAMGS